MCGFDSCYPCINSRPSLVLKKTTTVKPVIKPGVQPTIIKKLNIKPLQTNLNNFFLKKKTKFKFFRRLSYSAIFKFLKSNKKHSTIYIAYKNSYRKSILYGLNKFNIIKYFDKNLYTLNKSYEHVSLKKKTKLSLTFSLKNNSK